LVEGRVTFSKKICKNSKVIAVDWQTRSGYRPGEMRPLCGATPPGGSA
jgi:hypothetical protein